jgi:hypothetical protein
MSTMGSNVTLEKENLIQMVNENAPEEVKEKLVTVVNECAENVLNEKREF